MQADSSLICQRSEASCLLSVDNLRNSPSLRCSESPAGLNEDLQVAVAAMIERAAVTSSHTTVQVDFEGLVRREGPRRDSHRLDVGAHAGHLRLTFIRLLLHPSLVLYFPRLLWRTSLRLLDVAAPGRKGSVRRRFFSRDSILRYALQNDAVVRVYESDIRSCM
ncbi:hypothetical protein EXIGLDRAFT_719153 [Exidia glandulosa HHB12029]|uniref:Uncharacterized protein n=1 Tax=Exidia glandulosa HHB12029 TaxID=1314781 RepID=A0A165H9R2_EXIGL|nr:hypothetical protein EXIGLDRAFT_719153 [Exidia glandulosa HHB12029]